MTKSNAISNKLCVVHFQKFLSFRIFTKQITLDAYQTNLGSIFKYGSILKLGPMLKRGSILKYGPILKRGPTLKCGFMLKPGPISKFGPEKCLG